MKIKNLLVAIGFISFISLSVSAKESASPAEDRLDGKKITLARYAKSFVGQGNVTVDLAPFKYADGKEGAILLFKGVESPWDGKAILHEVVVAPQQGTGYMTQYKGKSWESLRTYPKGTYDLYVPEVKEAINLVPSDGAAQLTTPSAILQIYNEQQKTESDKP